MSTHKFQKNFTKGIEFKDKGNFGEALKYLRKAMEIDSNNVELWIQIAELWELLRMDELAMKSIWMIKGWGRSKFGGFAPNCVKAHLYEARLLMKHGMYKKAVESYDIALQIEPNNLIAKVGKETALEDLANIKFCTKCGDQLLKYERFCLECGKAIENT